ncbi:MAG: hypothetical protein ACI9WU_002528, partial [Myxococcota bacterium]
AYKRVLGKTVGGHVTDVESENVLELAHVAKVLRRTNPTKRPF